MPATGGAVLVCNHSDLFDAVIQGLYSGRQLTFLARAGLVDEEWKEKMAAARDELRDQPGDIWLDLAEEILGIFSQTLVDATAVPVVRNFKGGQATEAYKYYDGLLNRVVKLLSQGEAIAVYPEGTRSLDGKLHTFKGFAARIALEARVPVVPSALVGVYALSDVQRWAQGRNRNRSVIYRIGEPILPGEFPAGRSKRAIKELSTRMQNRVAALMER